ncbi:unnamed protein product [Candida verbasci]|uniref:Uncharacterized protein n=1 Tax=Candida verbasci TaxID=1227364 RepID=A0A9W4TY61_9ASCO|nr:unnamed protein product [Candida verbasci]
MSVRNLIKKYELIVGLIFRTFIKSFIDLFSQKDKAAKIATLTNFGNSIKKIYIVLTFTKHLIEKQYVVDQKLIKTYNRLNNLNLKQNDFIRQPNLFFNSIGLLSSTSSRTTNENEGSRIRRRLSTKEHAKYIAKLQDYSKFSVRYGKLVEKYNKLRKQYGY